MGRILISPRDWRALREPTIKKIAIANPKHAPYGRAAVAAMQYFKVYDQVKDKLILGENISQAAQFIESGACDAGIIALSLALAPAMKAGGQYWEIPATRTSASGAGRRDLEAIKKPGSREAVPRIHQRFPGTGDHDTVWVYAPELNNRRPSPGWLCFSYAPWAVLKRRCSPTKLRMAVSQLTCSRRTGADRWDRPIAERPCSSSRRNARPAIPFSKMEKCRAIVVCPPRKGRKAMPPDVAGEYSFVARGSSGMKAVLQVLGVSRPPQRIARRLRG